jgi:hypothetical protein
VRPRVWTRLALGAAACAATGGSPSTLTPTAPTDEPTLGTLAAPAPPPLTLPDVSPRSFHACSGVAGLQCATLTVPLDYADPGGTTIAIAVARLPALTSPARGSIVLNPGGPGESGIDYLVEAASRFTSLRATRNVVSFAPRGSGRSDPAHCLAPACADNPVPTTLATYVSEAQRMNAIDPHLGADTVWGDLVCAFWPFHPPPPSFHTVATALRLVGATGDPATPYQWAQGAIQFFPGSVLLTRDGDGHVSFGRSPCVDADEQAYLVKLTLPRAGTSCPTS